MKMTIPPDGPFLYFDFLLQNAGMDAVIVRSEDENRTPGLNISYKYFLRFVLALMIKMGTFSN